jgi:uncharacterized DUF497 family protein
MIMEYTWDENKAKSNFEKHGVRFEEAQVIWTDPLSIEYFDPENSSREERCIRIGLNPTRGILFVVFCDKCPVPHNLTDFEGPNPTHFDRFSGIKSHIV